MNGAEGKGPSAREFRERAKSVIFWSFIQYGGRRVLTFVFFALLARLISPEIYGTMAATLVFTGIGDLLVEQGLGKTLIQRDSLGPEHADTAFWTQIALAILVCAVGIAAAPWLAQLSGLPQLTPLIRVVAFSPLIGALGTVPSALLQRDLAFRPEAVRRLLSVLMGGLIAVGLAVAGFGVWSLVFQLLVGDLLGVIFLWRATSWRPGRQVSRRALEELLGFSGRLFLLNALVSLKSRADYFLIGAYLGPAALGVYVAAFRIAETVMETFVVTLSRFNLPLFSRLQRDERALEHAYDTSILLAATLGLPASAGLALAAQEVVEVLLGTQWTAAVPVLQITALVICYRAIASTNLAILMATGQIAFGLRVQACSTLLSVGLVVFLVPYGLAVTAMGNVACMLLILPINAWMVRRTIGYPMRRYATVLAPALAATAVMTLLILLARGPTAELPAAARLVLVSTLGAAGYGACLWYLSPTTRRLAGEAVRWLVERIRARTTAAIIRP